MKIVIISPVQLDKKLVPPSSKAIEVDNKIAQPLLDGGAACKPGDPRVDALFAAETKAAEAAAHAREQADKDAADAAIAAAKANWDQDEALRAKFDGKFDAYLASIASAA